MRSLRRLRSPAPTAGAVPAAALPDEEEVRRLGLRRWRVFAGIFVVYVAYGIPDLWRHHGPLGRAGGLALLAVFVVLYLGVLPLTFDNGRPAAFDTARPAAFDTGRPGASAGGLARYRHGVPLAMAALVVVDLVLIGPSGLLLLIYVGVAFVVAMPPQVSVPFVGLVAAGSLALPQYVDAWDISGLQWGIGGPILLTAFAMYGLRNSTAKNMALYQARAEVARLAAEHERLRIARDLHDLLGHALTTVALKAELASRLATRDSQRAADEMAEVAELARQGLADVRAAVGGYREVSLVTELAAAREVLRAAGIAAELPAAVETVPGELRELFGWVVREGVTNVVRHSRAQHVRVCLDERTIEIVDDGRGSAATAAGAAPAGSGLAGLSERVSALGGRVKAGRADEGGGFRLRVEVPA